MQNYLESYIRQKLQQKPILVMAHLVLGYPNFAFNLKQLQVMVEAGVDLVEMQIPFSEPTADGPVITNANISAINNGVRVEDCFDFAATVHKMYPQLALVFMSYVNILFQKGFANVVKKTASLGVKGWIVPDLPPEMAQEFLIDCDKFNISPIFIYTPTSSIKRLKLISKYTKGMVYAVARRGVTGRQSKFDAQIADRLALYKKITNKPLAVGFGIKSLADINFLKHKADVAVIGSKLIELIDQGGIKFLSDFLHSLNLKNLT